MNIIKDGKIVSLMLTLFCLLLVMGMAPRTFSADELEGEGGAAAESVASVAAMRSSARATRVTFDYFLKSGYAADSISDIPSVGRVKGDEGAEETEFAFPQKVFVELTGERSTVKPGEKLIVFDDLGGMSEGHSGFSKHFIKNLAIVKVLEVQKDRCQVQIVKSYDVFKAGARLKSYDREMEFWKKAKTVKQLPERSIECYVAQGDPGRAYWNQADPIILTAGRKQGVVEGAIFELREKRVLGALEDDASVESLCGMAKVFFAGPDYSVAIIVSNSHPVVRGFVAVYKP